MLDRRDGEITTLKWQDLNGAEINQVDESSSLIFNVCGSRSSAGMYSTAVNAQEHRIMSIPFEEFDENFFVAPSDSSELIALDVKKARDSNLEKLICDCAVADIELNFDAGSLNYFCDIEINIDRAEQ